VLRVPQRNARRCLVTVARFGQQKRTWGQDCGWGRPQAWKAAIELGAEPHLELEEFQLLRVL